MKRIFVAIKISEKVKRKISEYIKSLQSEFGRLRVGWEKREKLHLTLKFLGDLDESRLSELEKAVRRVSKGISKFRLNISETGVFPNRRKARVLWLGIDDEAAKLREIKVKLDTECEKFGYKIEKRKFNPHLTIARLREPHKSKKLIQKHLENEFEPVEFEVSEIVITESKLQPTGSVYYVLAEYKLAI